MTNSSRATNRTPLTHVATRGQIDNFLADPGQGLLLTGPAGSGKTYVAQYIAGQLLSVAIAKTITHPYVMMIEADNQHISIDAVRELQNFLSKRVPGQGEVKRVVIIADAETLTSEAQNALLKVLEEPPADTVILVLSDSSHALLPTVRSRLPELVIRPLSSIDVIDHVPGNLEPTQIERYLLLSGGRPGLFLSLLGEDNHPLHEQIQQAKQYLAASQFERLTADWPTNERTQLSSFLGALILACRGALGVATANNRPAAAKKWHKRSSTIYRLQRQLEQNASPKLIMMALALEV